MGKLKEKFEEYVEGVVWRCINIIQPARAEPPSPWLPTVSVTLDEGAKLPVRAHATDAGADLCCMEGFTVPAHSSVDIDTGVHVQLPRGTVGMVKSKSGLNIKACINVEGVIDEGYTGSIRLRVYNHGDYPKEFKAGDKVTQLVVMPVAYPTYVEVDEISGGERGDSGLGSTGK